MRGEVVQRCEFTTIVLAVTSVRRIAKLVLFRAGNAGEGHIRDPRLVEALSTDRQAGLEERIVDFASMSDAIVQHENGNIRVRTT